MRTVIGERCDNSMNSMKNTKNAGSRSVLAVPLRMEGMGGSSLHIRVLNEIGQSIVRGDLLPGDPALTHRLKELDARILRERKVARRLVG